MLVVARELNCGFSLGTPCFRSSLLESPLVSPPELGYCPTHCSLSDLRLSVVVWAPEDPADKARGVKRKLLRQLVPHGRPMTRDLGRCSFQTHEPTRLFDSRALHRRLGCYFTVDWSSASSHGGCAMLVLLTIIRVAAGGPGRSASACFGVSKACPVRQTRVCCVIYRITRRTMSISLVHAFLAVRPPA